MKSILLWSLYINIYLYICIYKYMHCIYTVLVEGHRNAVRYSSLYVLHGLLTHELISVYSKESKNFELKTFVFKNVSRERGQF